jgi:hypothetical protein
MTTLTATISNEFACLLSESQLSDDHSYLKMQTDCKKVITSGSWVISGSGWNRPGDILQFLMKWPQVPQKVTGDIDLLQEWIVKNLVPKISNIFTVHKAIDFDKGTQLINEAEFLIATHGKVFLLDEGFGITPITDFYVSGSGGKIALGAISALKEANPKKWNSNHHLISKAAVEAAVKFDLYSSGTIRGYRSYPSGKVEAILF